jgi:hypothetical protein
MWVVVLAGMADGGAMEVPEARVVMADLATIAKPTGGAVAGAMEVMEAAGEMVVTAALEVKFGFTTSTTRAPTNRLRSMSMAVLVGLVVWEVRVDPAVRLARGVKYVRTVIVRGVNTPIQTLILEIPLCPALTANLARRAVWGKGVSVVAS